jgi:hypothetical protein
MPAQRQRSPRGYHFKKQTACCVLQGGIFVIWQIQNLFLVTELLKCACFPAPLFVLTVSL